MTPSERLYFLLFRVNRNAATALPKTLGAKDRNTNKGTDISIPALSKIHSKETINSIVKENPIAPPPR